MSQKREKRLKILYFGSFDKPYDTEVYISETLRSIGHEVVQQPTGRVSKEYLEHLLSEQWDCVLLSKGWFSFQEEAAKMLREYKGLTIGWFWDLCWGTFRETTVYTHHLFQAKIVLTSDGGNIEKWENLGIKHRVLRQGIFEPEAVLGKYREEYACDVAFTGSLVHKDAFGWSHRTDLFNFLKDTYGERFKHFGTNGKEVRNLDLNDLFASAKVVVGDSVYSPNYWSNRLYETTGRGGFLLFPKVDGLEKEFEYFKHLVPYEYGDFAGLKEKIDYFIDHEEDRDRIRLAGFEHCKSQHTYTIRCKELVEIIQENKI